MSMNDLARAVNRDGSTISRWEAGSISRLPDRDTVVLLEQALECDGLLAAAGYSGTASGVSVFADALRSVLDAHYDEIVSDVLELVEKTNTS